MTSYDRNSSIFVTDTGIIGFMPRLRSGDLKSCIVAGLFGINLPYVPHRASDGNYEMVGLVYLANHILGMKSF